MSGLAMSGGNRALLGGDELVPTIGGDEVVDSVFGGDEVGESVFGGDEGAPAFI
jgi:hypothetical protein